MAKLRAMQRLPSPIRGLVHSAILLGGIALTPASQAAEPDLDRPNENLASSLTEKATPMIYALSLIGTPYRLGGQNPETGVDCSGFVKHVYAKTTDLTLPRSASEISQKGEAVDKNQLKPGDLVFFNTRKRPFSHVGIYQGEGKFVHASSSRTGKVLVSNMGQRYWLQRFNGARRLLP